MEQVQREIKRFQNSSQPHATIPTHNRKSTIDTILKRNDSNNAMKQYAVPFNSLHKKTYFNALEMILNSP